ncbi:MAG: ABC transporter ATP-binding protein [Gemmatimonadales bacterium]
MPAPDAKVAFHGVWKRFRRGEGHDSLRDLLPALTRRAFRRLKAGELGTADFWALQDVSFEVLPGQALGIIGANGAGKSTALKILTRILRPTRGHSVITGRVGALIEISAGFHPDLTGRENIFLQGTIMGMRTAQIRARFDQIVEFSGISEFIDTPVKRYSSGMNAKLGFSIAAHLDPDVLIIDEVLSVGDFVFQRRAFDRIAALARSGIPVVVVSHQLNRVLELCTDCLLLHRGRVVKQGLPAECIAQYVLGASLDSRSDTSTDCPVELHTVELPNPGPVRSGEWLQLRVRGRITRPVTEDLEHVGLRIRALHTGEAVFATSSKHCRLQLPEVGPFTVDTELQVNVPPGSYVAETAVWDPRHAREAFTGPVIRIDVMEGPSFWGPVQMNARMAVR